MYVITCPFCEEIMKLKEVKTITNKSYKSYDLKIHQCRECQSEAEVMEAYNQLSVMYQKSKKKIMNK